LSRCNNRPPKREPTHPKRAAGGDPDRFLVTVSAPFAETWARADRRAELAHEGIDRVVMLVHPPFDRRRIEALAPLLRA
jgi:hypothetical protein